MPRHRGIHRRFLRLTCSDLRQDTSSVSPVDKRLRILCHLCGIEPDRRNVDDELDRHRVVARHPVKQGVGSRLGSVESHDVTVPTSSSVLERQLVAEGVFEDTLPVAKGDADEGLAHAGDRHGLWL